MSIPSKGHGSQLPQTFLLIGISWSILIAALIFFEIKSIDDNTNSNTFNEAQAFFKQILVTRYWNASHGGVYIPVTSETQPNPYLDVPNRDIVTQDGQNLTLINPAYMTRQIAEKADNLGHIKFHITSLKPINPGNTPLAWEAKALANFSRTSPEYSEWFLPENSDEEMFRYMSALWVEKPCLVCHAKQGYVEGDLRGGISVTIPAKDIISQKAYHRREAVISYLGMWFIGILALIVSYRRSIFEYRTRTELIEKLESALQNIKSLKGLIPICASCKKVRNDSGYWEQVEEYITVHTDAGFTHGICPDCREKLYPELASDHPGKKAPPDSIHSN